MLGCTFCSVDDNDIVLRSRFQDLEPAQDDEGDEDDRPVSNGDGLFANLLVADTSSNGSSQKVKQYVTALSSVFEKEGWAVEYLQDDHYLVNGRDVCIFLLPAGVPVPSAKGVERALSPAVAQFASRMMVSDGPLLQPLLDYLLQTGENEHYDIKGTENPAAVTGLGRRLEFNTKSKDPNDRVEAMLQATLQAEMRRKVSSQPLQAATAKTPARAATVVATNVAKPAPKVAAPSAAIVNTAGRGKAIPNTVSIVRKTAK